MNRHREPVEYAQRTNNIPASYPYGCGLRFENRGAGCQARLRHGDRCLNGTMIVSLDGKYGLADTSGREILAPEYDDVYYISDEIAVAFTGQNVGFFDQNGRRLGETVMEGEASVDDLLAAYSKIEKMRREQWNSILTSYEELRKYCQSDSASVVTANIMADDIRAALQKVGGPMEKDQKVRFETEYSAYRR